MTVASLHPDKSRYLELNQVLGHFAQQRSVAHKQIATFASIDFAVWCKFAGLWQIVTDELLDFLRKQIGDARCLEICAGRGILGRELNCKQTDASICVRPEVALLLKHLQERTDPSPHERLEALDAIEKYKPDIVMGAWVTQHGTAGESSPFGVDEASLLKRVKKYIMIGNESSHGRKEILKLKHKTYRAPWLVSRSMHPEQNVIYIWER